MDFRNVKRGQMDARIDLAGQAVDGGEWWLHGCDHRVHRCMERLYLLLLLAHRREQCVVLRAHALHLRLQRQLARRKSAGEATAPGVARTKRVVQARERALHTSGLRRGHGVEPLGQGMQRLSTIR